MLTVTPPIVPVIQTVMTGVSVTVSISKTLLVLTVPCPWAPSVNCLVSTAQRMQLKEASVTVKTPVTQVRQVCMSVKCILTCIGSVFCVCSITYHGKVNVLFGIKQQVLPSPSFSRLSYSRH